MRKPIIDMRCRPAMLHPFYGGTPGTMEHRFVVHLNHRVGSRDPEHFMRVQTLGDLVEEIHGAGITRSVVLGRAMPGVRIPNDQVADIMVQYPETFVGVGAVDPQDGGEQAAITAVDRAVNILGLKGINLDPGFLQNPLKPNDPSLYPIYYRCQELDVPVFLMSGPIVGPTIDYTHPAYVGEVAARFPDLKIVCAHGFYPFVSEIIGVAFKHENVYVCPDMYLFLPGAHPYVEAANGFMQDQFLFGTAYPFRPLEQTVEDFLHSGFRDAVLDKILYQNAARVLELAVEPK